MNFAVVLELFSGTGRFSEAMGSHRAVLLWDISMGPAYDLADRSKQRLVLGWLRAGLVCGVWMGTPCHSFSRVRNKPGGAAALRSKEAPLGLPGLSCGDAASVRLGNCLAAFSAQVLLLCALLLIPGAVENPATSWIWSTPWMQRLAARGDVRLATTEFCQWQRAPFKKSTSFLHTCVDLTAVSAKRCSGGARGVCCATGRPHQPLVGFAPSSVDAQRRYWTKIAEPYPKRLCLQLALAFDSGIACRRWRLASAVLPEP